MPEPMKINKLSSGIQWVSILAAAVFASAMLSGCNTLSGDHAAITKTAEKAKAIRINAGATAPYTDPAGNLWLPDQGFVAAAL